MSLLHHTLRRGMLIACGLSLSISALSMAAPPTDQQIQEKLAALAKWQKEAKPAERTFENFQKQVQELLADVEVESLTVKQLDTLSDLLMNDPAKADAANERLASMAKEPTAEGAHAAIVLASISMRDREAMAEALKSALQHPKVIDAAGTTEGSQIFSLISYAEDSDLADMSEEVLALRAALNADLPTSALRGAMDYLAVLKRFGDKVDAKTQAEVREKVINLYAAAADKARAAEEPDTRAIKAYENSIAFLKGAASRGELINYPAPPLTVEWSSSEQPLTGLDALKGKVVVLDFWATWCGPCIASFPAVRELQERYKDYDVVILGVTSLQGNHYPGDGKPKVDTTDDPQKEYALMKEFMAAKEMTWDVVFTKEDVFNPEFGVRGIPHVAIIDPEGKVQYNGLHPMSPMSEKTQKIDGLLKKAGLAHPAPIAEEPEAEGADGPDGQ